MKLRRTSVLLILALVFSSIAMGQSLVCLAHKLQNRGGQVEVVPQGSFISGRCELKQAARAVSAGAIFPLLHRERELPTETCRVGNVSAESPSRAGRSLSPKTTELRI